MRSCPGGHPRPEAGGSVAHPAPHDAPQVLNAGYGDGRAPAGVPHHGYRRERPADGSIRPHVLAGTGLDAATVTTAALRTAPTTPAPARPGRRLRWAELARRAGGPVVPDGLPPCHGRLPSVGKEGSRPPGIPPPARGAWTVGRGTA